MEKEESSNDDALPDVCRIDPEGDIYAQLDRLDESLNNELEDLKRMLTATSTCTALLQVSEEDNTNEPDDCTNDADDENAQPQSQSVEQAVVNNRTEKTGHSNEARRHQRNPQRARGKNPQKPTIHAKKNHRNQKKLDDDSDVKQVDCANDDDEIVAQPQSHSTAKQEAVKHHDDTKDKSMQGMRHQRSPQRRRRNNTRDSRGNNNQKKTTRPAKEHDTKNQRKQVQETKMLDGVVNEDGKNGNADSSSTPKKMAKSSSAANKEVDTSPTPKKTQPKRMEGRGRGSRRRQALQRHQEQDKQPNNDEATKGSTAAEAAEGKGRRARARRSRVRREQQKINDESTATESRKKKDNLSTEQKQRIIDSLNQGRNNFLSR
eukprot:scaffold1028_cov157-Skeletonema_menzelii.AAC.8